MRTQINLSRQLAFGAHLTGPNPSGGNAERHFYINLTGQDMVDLQSYVPYTFIWTNRGHVYETGGRTSFGQIGGLDGRDLWGSDFVCHLHDDADGGMHNRLRMKIWVRGVSMTGRLLEETFEISNEGRDGDPDDGENLPTFVSDAYYRSRFAYGWFRKRVVEYEGTPTTDDFLYIGFDPRDHYDPLWRTHARERHVRWGIPFAANSIQDVQCVKIDRTPVGVGAAGQLAKNIRGIYPIDLQQAGALFDREDNAIIVNDALELTRSHLFDAQGEGFALEAAPSLGNFLLLFSVDAENPEKFLANPISAKYDDWLSFRT